MKICFICPEYPNGPHGGIGTYTQQTARGLSELGHEVRVIGVYPKKYPAKNYEEDGTIRIWRLREWGGKFGWLIPWIKQFMIIKKWIQNNDIELVEAPDSRGWYSFWGKLTVPVILRFHGSQMYISSILEYKPNKITAFLELQSYKRADAYSSVSYFNAKKTTQIANLSKDVQVIYNGIKIIQLLKIPRKKSTIVFAGTLIEYKGIVDFLESLVLLANDGVEFDVGIYGKDALIGNSYASEIIEKYSILSELKSRIKYYGVVSVAELLSIYQSATVAVFPSHVESFGLAPIEAMMCECPVIFTDNTTGPEIIEPKVDGLLVKPKKTF